MFSGRCTRLEDAIPHLPHLFGILCAIRRVARTRNSIGYMPLNLTPLSKAKYLFRVMWWQSIKQVIAVHRPELLCRSMLNATFERQMRGFSSHLCAGLRSRGRNRSIRRSQPLWQQTGLELNFVDYNSGPESKIVLSKGDSSGRAVIHSPEDMS